ncbi:MAG: YgfZ/GcvT domain-containing protein [Lysobacter sp.]
MDGRDAAAFAQAQFMNDLNGLQAGQWHWNGWLAPKGRVLALFALLKWSEQRIWLLVPDADAIALTEGLKRFLFRSKVAIEVRDDLQVRGAFATPAIARDNTFSDDGNNSVELDMGAEGGARYLRLIAREQPSDTDVAQDGTGEIARWKAFDLEHGLPRLPASQLEHWTPQQLSLDRLHGFSVKKGCYPGQEIVARTHFLGKAKRGLALLQGDASMTAGDEVRAGDAVLGAVIASADADGRHVALAVLPLGREASPLSLDDQLVREGALKAGLAR